MQGFLQKRIMLSMWHRRWFELDGGVLQWRRDRGEAVDAKKRLVLAPGATVERGGLTLTVASGGTTVVVAAESEADAERWLAALVAACGGPAATAPSAAVAAAAAAPLVRVSADTVPSPGARRKASDDAAPGFAPPPPPLPDRVTIEGLPEVGSELRLRVAVGDAAAGTGPSLEVLCLQWARLPADEFTLRDATAAVDLLAIPGARSIAGAVGECYSVTDEDVGWRLGCSVRRAAGGGGGASRWALLTPAACSRPPAAVRVRAELRPHEHSKYCDRRVRVCTAAGRYREGAVLRAVPVGPPEVLARYVVAWYRAAPAAATRAGRGGGAAPAPAAGDDDGGHSGTLVPTPRGPSLYGAGGTRYARALPRPVAHLPPAPPDYEASLPLPELKRRLALGHSAWPPPGGAPPPPRADAVAAGTAPCDYPLFADDVGSLILCALVPVGVEPPSDVIVSGGSLGGVQDAGVITGPPPPLLPPEAPPGGATHTASAFGSGGGGAATPLVPTPPLSAAPGTPVPRPPAAPRRNTAPTSPPGTGGSGPAAPSSSLAGAAAAAAAAVPVPPAPTPPATDATVATAAAAPAPASAVAFVLSPAVGAVEAAPPRAREVWIEGTPSVGATLTGHAYYYGGRMGASTHVSWVAINDDGEQVELTPFAPARPPAAARGAASPAAFVVVGSAPPAPSATPPLHAPLSTLALEAQHAGHLIKFRVRPARDDGDEGHTESSRPTAEVVAGAPVSVGGSGSAPAAASSSASL